MRPRSAAPGGFSAPAWLGSAHLQSLSAALPFWAPPRSFSPESSEAIRIPLPSGGALRAVAWWQKERAPAAILVHGVAGSIASRYVVRAAVSLYRAGWHAVRVDLRGAGASVEDAPGLYHAGLTEDPRAALDVVSRDPRVDGVGFVGFSLGGHVLLRMAGELGDDAPPSLRAIVSISAPLDLSAVSRAIERPGVRLYQHYVLQNLVRTARDFARARPERAHYAVSALGRLATVRAYDTAVVAPMHGFSSAEDYYERASAGPLVARIRVPTLVLHAEDDPLVPAATVRPWLPRGAGGPVAQAWTRRGGHVGWFAGLSEASWVDTWAMRSAHSFLASRHPA
jgi:predicted alpha/beta-fold hydrolase